MIGRVSAPGAVAAALLPATAGLAEAQSEAAVLAAPSMDSLGPVGLSAVVLGVAGMVVGVFRKKKIQPENQRKG
ncbi:hypothetical protein QFW96_09515 [Saccharopolyspora sp. TS4A08]|uniref:LPXTG cell wall anchor domain-containing protein n=1 Tax=Saccharopolyspora ipomoeae TaxID=3042027 RepID=A0ABT6PLH4_9PSEU|nr:hypothetical protein [Saccharopolyspora sp. TS4A08]MDI2028849.1 hypothetical protein [Saccharopolyspora sp. TS4A08]